MSTDNYPTQSNDQYTPNLDAQADELAAGGSNKLFYMLGALILALVLGYIALPKGHGEGLSSVTPTFMLDDAAVLATAPTAPTASDSIAAGLKAAPATVDEDAETTAPVTAATKPAAVARPVATAAPAAVASPTEAPVAAASEAVAAPEPAPAAPAPASAQISAPANVILSGHIEDENGRPLVGATVLLRGGKGTSTDASGNYSMEVPGNTENILIYGYGGYEDTVVKSHGSQPVNVTLTPREKTGKKRR